MTFLLVEGRCNMFESAVNVSGGIVFNVSECAIVFCIAEGLVRKVFQIKPRLLLTPTSIRNDIQRQHRNASRELSNNIAHALRCRSTFLSKAPTTLSHCTFDRIKHRKLRTSNLFATVSSAPSSTPVT